MIASIRRGLWCLRGCLYRAPAAITVATVCLFIFWAMRVAARTEFVYGYTFAQALMACFGLNWPLLARGFLWQPVTYMFLHANWVHLGLNMLTVLLLGAGLEQEIGARRFWRVFLVGGVVGGVGWLIVTALAPWMPSCANLTKWLPAAARTWLGEGGGGGLNDSLCIGASGGVFALIGAYAALFPRREIYILLLFVPLRMQARTLALVLGLATIAEGVFLQSQVAHAAHLAGGLGGYLMAMRMRGGVFA